MIEALEENGFRLMRDKLSASLNEGRVVCANRVPVEAIIQDFHENREFYDSWLSRLLGKVGSKAPAKPIYPPAAPANSTSPQATPNVSNAPSIVHVEFGRVVQGPPPRPSGVNPANSISPHAQPQHSEQLASVNIGLSNGQPTEFALPVEQRAARTENLRWLTRGESIQIQGHTLPHGLVYVGKGTDSERRYALDPGLPAKAGVSTGPATPAYNFSYPAFSPEQRSRYLDWLAQGAASSTEASFGMLYFYGLERRVLDLIPGKIPDPPSGELEQLLREVGRLGGIFKPTPGSVQQCCLRLLDLAAVQAIEEGSIPALSKEWVRTFELPFILRYGIGCFMRDGKPIPADWALRWACLEPTIYLRTAAVRCPKEFEAAFTSIYREKFGDGLIIPANKTKLKLVYQQGWPMRLGPEIKYGFSGVPDVAALKGTSRSPSPLRSGHGILPPRANLGADQRYACGFNVQLANEWIFCLSSPY